MLSDGAEYIQAAYFRVRCCAVPVTFLYLACASPMCTRVSTGQDNAAYSLLATNDTREAESTRASAQLNDC